MTAGALLGAEAQMKKNESSSSVAPSLDFCRATAAWGVKAAWPRQMRVVDVMATGERSESLGNT